jgi:hypothetical protein
MGVYMSELCVKSFVLFFDYPHRLLVIAVDSRLDLWVKLDLLEYSNSSLHFSTCSRQRYQLSLSSRLGD